MGGALEKYGCFVIFVVLGAVYRWVHVGPGHHSCHYSPTPRRNGKEGEALNRGRSSCVRVQSNGRTQTPSTGWASFTPVANRTGCHNTDGKGLSNVEIGTRRLSPVPPSRPTSTTSSPILVSRARAELAFEATRRCLQEWKQRRPVAK